MDKQVSKPIRIVSNNGRNKAYRAYAWLIGQEAKWAMSASPFYIDDADILAKVNPEQLARLRVLYPYLSHLEHLAHEQVDTPAPDTEPIGAATPNETKTEPKAKRPRKTKTPA